MEIQTEQSDCANTFIQSQGKGKKQSSQLSDMPTVKSYFVLKTSAILQNCIACLKSLALDKYDVTIQRKTKNRTLQQNKFYWGAWLGVFEDWNGDSKEEWHKRFKVAFLGVNKTMCMGVELVEPKSSANLTTEEFGVFLDKVEAFAISQELKLPPRDYYGL